MILRGGRCSGVLKRLDSRRVTEQLEFELMLGIVRKGSKRKGFVVATTGVVPYYDTTFFFVNGSCYCLKALYPFV